MTTQKFKEIKANIKAYIGKKVSFRFTDCWGYESLHTGSISGTDYECIVIKDDTINMMTYIHFSFVSLS